MNRRFLPLLVILASVALFTFCGEDPADPVDDDDDPGSPYNGLFQMRSELVTNNCVLPVPPDVITTIVIEGDSMLFGGFPGEWNEATLTGTGDTPEYTVPVDPPTCYSYYTVTYVITFVNADSFSGTYGSDFRKDPGCINPDPCAFRYNISGWR